jgi:glycosyltransferase involved in cell wall biosynthesis
MINENVNNPEKVVKVGIVFLGTRGGGPELLLQVSNSLSRANIQATVLVSKRNEKLNNVIESGHEIIYFDAPNKRRSVPRWMFKLNKELNRLTEQVLELELESLIFLQPHYLDYFIVKKFSKLGKSITYTVHDFPPHLGEFFPPKLFTRAIVRMVGSTITLNPESYELILKFNPKTIRCKLPKFVSRQPETPKTIDVLFIGRIRKYKGLILLQSAFEILDTSRYEIMVAGSGKLRTKFGPDITVKISWISHETLVNLVRQSKVLVLPYLEASQSGLVEIAKGVKTTIVVTPVPNLVSQVRDGGIAVVSEGFAPKQLASAIERALGSEAVQYQNDNETMCLDEYIVEALSKM